VGRESAKGEKAKKVRAQKVSAVFQGRGETNLTSRKTGNARKGGRGKRNTRDKNLDDWLLDGRRPYDVEKKNCHQKNREELAG